MTKTAQKGLYFALAAAFISGVSIFINKFAVDVIKNPLVFTTTKNTGVALMILGFLFASGKIKKVQKLKKRELAILGLIGIIGGSIPFYLFFTGLSMIPAANGAIIQKTLVLWVAVLALPFLGERLSKKGWFAVILLFAGNVLVGGFKEFSLSIGELYVLLATVFWAIEIVLSKKILPKVDPDILVEARMGIGAVILLGMSAVIEPRALASVLAINSTKWFWLVLTMASLLAYLVVWYRGLKFAPVTTATAVLVASTLVTNILSAIFVTHSLNTLTLVQSLVISLGVILIYKLEKKGLLSSNKIAITN